MMMRITRLTAASFQTQTQTNKSYDCTLKKKKKTLISFQMSNNSHFQNVKFPIKHLFRSSSDVVVVFDLFLKQKKNQL